MSIKEGRDYLFLIWKSEKDRKQYIIGELSKNSHYEFKYCNEVEKAMEQGFKPLVSFPDVNGVYISNELFPVFESRLPDRRRKDMDIILQKYDMKEFEPYQLLKRSGARLPIDNLFFIDPIIDTTSSFKRIFFLAGVRHYLGCDGNDCGQAFSIDNGETLALKVEPDNVKDKKAVEVLDKNSVRIGYIPRYYNNSLFELIQEGRNMKCTVINVDKKQCCDECIKVMIDVQ